MFLFSLALARLVPVLFAVSAALIAGRFSYDRLSGRHPALARVLFTACVLAGLAALTPYIVRSGYLVGAEDAFSSQDWEAAARRYAGFTSRGGTLSPTMGYQWGEALMNRRLWLQAEAVLLKSVGRPSPGVAATSNETVLALGICRYYSGRFEAAEKTLRAVTAPALGQWRSYFLGRLAERRGDVSAALAAYQASLDAEPHFFPALYQLVRVRMSQGDVAGAAKALEAAVARGGLAPGNSEARLLADAVEGRAPGLPEKEFILVQKN